MSKLSSKIDNAIDSINPWSQINKLKNRYGASDLKGKALEYIKDLGLRTWQRIKEEVFGKTETTEGERDKKLKNVDVSTSTSSEGSGNGDSYQILEDSGNMKEMQEMMRNQLIPRFNEYRKQLGENLPELKCDEGLSTSAEKQLRKYMSDPQWRKKHSHDQTIEESQVGEIVTSGRFRTAEDALKNFLSSPLHRWYLRRGFTKMGFCALQGEDGKWYVNVHMSGAKPEKAPEDMKIGQKRELDEEEVEFITNSRERSKTYWEEKKEIDMSHIPEDIRSFLESHEMVNNKTKWTFSILEALRAKKYEWLRMTLDKKHSEELSKKENRAMVVLQLGSDNGMKTLYAIDPSLGVATPLLIEDTSTEKDGENIQKVTSSNTFVALDLLFDHFKQSMDT